MDRVKETNRLIEQGYSKEDIEKENTRKLIRWTPFACVAFSLVGIGLQSDIYFFVLALLTSVGLFTSHSFYDHLYLKFFSKFLKLGTIPNHSWHRRVGCGLGVVVFLNAALQLYFHNIYIALIPVVAMSTMAFIAGIYNWCFVTVVFRMFKKDCSSKACC